MNYNMYIVKDFIILYIEYKGYIVLYSFLMWVFVLKF